MKLKHLLNKHRLEIFVVLFLIVVAVLYFSDGTRAQAPPSVGSGGYDAPAPLNPECKPNDPDYDCFVKPAGGAFEKDTSATPNVIRQGNSPDYRDEVFVFGSPQLNDDPDAHNMYDARLYFYKFMEDKTAISAFRAGTVTGEQWDIGSKPPKVGNFSTAMGFDTTASGKASFAVGYKTTASKDYSTAMGKDTTASGDYSTAMGWNTTASGPASTAMGYNTTASGQYSTAMGYGIWANAIGVFGINLDPDCGGAPCYTITDDNVMSIMGGNVGIGTVSPLTKLEVDGDIQVTAGNDICIDGGNCLSTTPKVYRALLSQTGGTDDPTATVLENNLGATINWTRISPGAYRGTASSPVFTDNKTFLMVAPPARTQTKARRFLVSSTTVIFLDVENDANSPADGYFDKTAIEILVYP